MTERINIEQMGTEELLELVMNIKSAWERLNPDDELILISLPKKDLRERNRTIDYIYKVFESATYTQE